MTGQAQYAQEAERAVFNSLMAAQAGDGVTWCYYTRANQDRRPYETAIKCCSSSGPRALEMFSRYLVGEVEGGVSLTCLAPCSVVLPDSLGGAKVKVTGNFPISPNITIRFEEASGESFALEFRDPVDSQLKSARINGQEIRLSKNDRGYYQLRRPWETDDALALEFEYLLRSHAETPKNAQSWVAFTYGPCALAQTTNRGVPLDEPFAEKDISSGPASEWLEPDAALEGAEPRFRVKNTNIVLGPYYGAGSKETGPRTYFKTGQILPDTSESSAE